MAQITRKYTDLDLNLTPHPITGDITKLKDERAIIGSLKNLMFTNFYERLFKPSIGSNIKRMLFEPLDGSTAYSLKQAIELTVENYEPRVKLVDTKVTADYDNNGYNVTMTFYIQNSAEPITIRAFLERVR